MTPPHQTTLFSKSAFEKLPIFSDDFLLASDLNYLEQILNRLQKELS